MNGFRWTPCIAFMAFFALGFSSFFDFQSMNSAYIKLRVDDRFPANLRQGYDISAMSDQPLRVATMDSFMKSASITSSSSSVIINLNQFAARTKGGEMTLSCLVYDRVQLTFEAEGEASSGDKPIFVVRAPCSFEKEDIVKLRAIPIPVASLLSQPASSREYRFAKHPSHFYEFRYGNGHWPRTWALRTVQFQKVGRDGGESLIFSAKEKPNQKKAKKASRPLKMVW